MLEGAGHQAFAAFDGASALKASVRTPPPDLIVLDLQMPAGDGITTLTKLRQSSRTALIPVLVVTASKDPHDRQRVQLLGASAFLEKPVSPDTFIDAVEAFARKAK